MASVNVWLFYPNLVGYARIIFGVLSFEAMMYAPFRAAIFYIISVGLDAVDGELARRYNQCSSFGAMLDQLTDRCSTLGLIMILGTFYPKYIFWFQFSAVVDIASHWLHFHATLLTGQTTHKASNNRILHLYYTSRKFLFFMCAGNEAFYWLMYINHFWSGPGFLGIYLISLLAFCCFPIAFMKSLISLVHLGTACQTIVTHDVDLQQKKDC